MSLSRIESLDEILKWFNNDHNSTSFFSEDQILDGVIKLVPDLKSNIHFLPDCIHALKKLEKDGFIERNDQGKLGITFEGLVYIDSGGYKGNIEKETIAYQILDRNNRLLVIGSWLAGIGTVLLFSVELWKVLCSFCH